MDKGSLSPSDHNIKSESATNTSPAVQSGEQTEYNDSHVSLERECEGTKIEFSREVMRTSSEEQCEGKDEMIPTDSQELREGEVQDASNDQTQCIDEATQNSSEDNKDESSSIFSCTSDVSNIKNGSAEADASDVAVDISGSSTEVSGVQKATLMSSSENDVDVAKEDPERSTEREQGINSETSSEAELNLALSESEDIEPEEETPTGLPKFLEEADRLEQTLLDDSQVSNISAQATPVNSKPATPKPENSAVLQVENLDATNVESMPPQVLSEDTEMEKDSNVAVYDGDEVIGTIVTERKEVSAANNVDSSSEKPKSPLEEPLELKALPFPMDESDDDERLVIVEKTEVKKKRIERQRKQSKKSSSASENQVASISSQPTSPPSMTPSVLTKNVEQTPPPESAGGTSESRQVSRYGRVRKRKQEQEDFIPLDSRVCLVPPAAAKPTPSIVAMSRSSKRASRASASSAEDSKVPLVDDVMYFPKGSTVPVPLSVGPGGRLPPDNLDLPIEYELGQIVWARLEGYPFWPALITRDPKSTSICRLVPSGRHSWLFKYHVNFLGDLKRGWMLPTQLLPYEGRAAMEEMKRKYIATHKKSDSGIKAYQIRSNLRAKFDESVEQAEGLMECPRAEVIDLFHLDFFLTQPQEGPDRNSEPVVPAAPKLPNPVPPRKTSKSKETPVANGPKSNSAPKKKGPALTRSSAPPSGSKRGMPRIVFHGSSSSKKSTAVRKSSGPPPLIPADKEATALLPMAPEKPEVAAPKEPAEEEDEPLEDYEDTIPVDPIRQVDLEQSIPVEPVKKSAAQKNERECSLEEEEEAEELGSIGESWKSFKQEHLATYRKLHPKMSRFKLLAMLREDWCETYYQNKPTISLEELEQVGDAEPPEMVNGFDAEEQEERAVESPTKRKRTVSPTKGTGAAPKIQKTPTEPPKANAVSKQTPTTKSASSSTKSTTKPLTKHPQSEKTSPQVSTATPSSGPPKPGQAEEAKHSDSSKSSHTSNGRSAADKDPVCFACDVLITESTDLIKCGPSGGCGATFHCTCLDNPPSDTSSTYKCRGCTLGRHPCFICKETDSQTRKCSQSKCARFYHISCLKNPIWQQTEFTNPLAFMCPLHVCHLCASEDTKDPKAKVDQDRLLRCLRCPSAYHNEPLCYPAGSQLINSQWILCSRHFKARKAKICHVSANWCFLCSKGGSLICCENCPGAFHLDCLGYTPPEGGYICDNCESGKVPVYGDVVWAKVGNYRWWPAEIKDPSSVPQNVESIPHQLGEFPVKFFGSYDYYWLSRGRVFWFEEGDETAGLKKSSTERGLEGSFKRAVDEAKEAFDLMTEKKKLHAAKINERAIHHANPCGPGGRCLNRMLMIECHPDVCPAGSRCQNQRFVKREYPKLEPFFTGTARGWGLRSPEKIAEGQFVIEYVGELIDEQEYKDRMKTKHQTKDENYYFLTVDKDRIIDAGIKGNVARFMNHSCQDPENGSTKASSSAPKTAAPTTTTKATDDPKAEAQDKAKKKAKASLVVVKGSPAATSTPAKRTPTVTVIEPKKRASMVTVTESKKRASVVTVTESKKRTSMVTVAEPKKQTSVSVVPSKKRASERAVSSKKRSSETAVPSPKRASSSSSAKQALRRVRDDSVSATLNKTPPRHSAKTAAVASPKATPVNTKEPPMTPVEQFKASFPASGRTKVKETACFRCGVEGGLDVFSCNHPVCPKVYHLSCLDLDYSPDANWFCPWHFCDLCGEGIQLRCDHCPNSYCAKHLDNKIRQVPPLMNVCDDHAPEEVEELRQYVVAFPNMLNKYIRHADILSELDPCFSFPVSATTPKPEKGGQKRPAPSSSSGGKQKPPAKKKRRR
ncbi:unnamed protein product [Cyprideis torosa]|uniref:Uncharacterized protein n=1 Tax=Cyprideis torosa TaxID=163714 RepID=A0A7R8W1M9_9CRUS|nr:unnamed protein product [Cyprideis torosa]CAG0881123.1 unnamed protein product [Cyprideis torosa]